MTRSRCIFPPIPRLCTLFRPLAPGPVKIPKSGSGPVKKNLNWSYRASKHFETFLLKTSFPSRISPNVFEINEDKINKEISVVAKFYALFFLGIKRKICRTSNILR